jgi:hypothetical protein
MRLTKPWLSPVAATSSAWVSGVSSTRRARATRELLGAKRSVGRPPRLRRGALAFDEDPQAAAPDVGVAGLVDPAHAERPTEVASRRSHLRHDEERYARRPIQLHVGDETPSFELDARGRRVRQDLQIEAVRTDLDHRIDRAIAADRALRPPEVRRQELGDAPNHQPLARRWRVFRVYPLSEHS